MRGNNLNHYFTFSSCARLGLTTFAYLWQRDQSELLAEMIGSGVQAILIKVAALGLDPSLHLGRDISDVAPHLMRMVRLHCK